MAKRKRSSDGDGDAEVDMTPMIDIVFQLLAFFMVITNFEQTQADERVKLPRDSLAKPPEAKADDTLVLNVGFIRDMQGKKTDSEPWLFNIDDGNDLRPLEAGPQLMKEARLYTSKQVEVKGVVVKVRSDSEVQTGVIQELIKLCQDAGFETFAMSAMSGPAE